MMSRQRDFIRWILGTTFMVAIVMTAAWTLESKMTPAQNSNMREPASIPQGDQLKQEILNSKPLSQIQPGGKPSGLFNVRMASLDQNPVTAGSVLHLEAKVEAQRDIEGVRFAWLLPSSGVEFVSGPVEGDIISLQAGEEITLRLSVKSETDENRHIHLHVYKIVNGEAMGKMTQYNTVHQPQIDSEMRAKSEVLRQMKEAGVHTHKIMQ